MGPFVPGVPVIPALAAGISLNAAPLSVHNSARLPSHHVRGRLRQARQ